MVFYSSAIRRAELIELSVADIDWERRTLLIRLGKGKRDRVVPIGQRALGWVRRYLEDARPELIVLPDEETLFLNYMGGRLDSNDLTKRIGRYVRQAKVGKTGSCHLFRHSVATLMLENGADLRHLQVLLGHSQTSTTAIYTRVSVRRLQEVHDQTHPGAEGRGADGSKVSEVRGEDGEP